MKEQSKRKIKEDNISFPGGEERRKTLELANKTRPDLSKKKGIYVKQIKAMIFVDPKIPDDVAIAKYLKKLHKSQNQL